MKKNRLFVVICVLVVSFSLCVPAFASSGSSLLEVSTDSSNRTFICVSNPGNIQITAFATEPNVYCCAYWYNSQQLNIVLGSSSQFSANVGGQSYSAVLEDGFYFTQRTQGGVSSSGVSSSLPIFSSYADCKAALMAVSSPDTGEPISVVLPAGNVIFVELPSGQANQIEASTSSALDHSSPWNGSNQAWGYASSLPSSNFSVPYPGTSPFSWKHAGKTNIFGTTRNWSFFSLLDSSNKYLVVVNPAYPEDQPTNQAINGSITLSLPHALSYRVYSLSTEWSSGNLVGSWDSETDPTFSGDYDPDTGSWGSVNDQTGSPGSPSAGGNNIVSESGQNIHDWLQSIANSISGFFNGAIGAVTTLTSAASEFVGSFIHLYSWLPTSVLSVLTSAIILAITIGVIKVFI